MRIQAFAAALALAISFLASPLCAAPLLTNGNFETGTFAGWTVVNKAGGTGNFIVDTPGTTTPISAHTTQSNPSGGAWYAVSDQTGPGTHALLQSFTVPSMSKVTLSFDMFVNSYGSPHMTVNSAGLDHTASPNEHGRVDILMVGAGPLSTAAGDVVASLYIGADPLATANPFAHYKFDLSPIVGQGGQFQLRFAEADNVGFFNMGVDNVLLDATSMPTPEPSSVLVWLFLGLVGVGLGTTWGFRSRTNRVPSVVEA